MGGKGRRAGGGGGGGGEGTRCFVTHSSSADLRSGERGDYWHTLIMHKYKTTRTKTARRPQSNTTLNSISKKKHSWRRQNPHSLIKSHGLDYQPRAVRFYQNSSLHLLVGHHAVPLQRGQVTAEQGAPWPVVLTEDGAIDIVEAVARHQPVSTGGTGETLQRARDMRNFKKEQQKHGFLAESYCCVIKGLCGFCWHPTGLRRQFND